MEFEVNLSLSMSGRRRVLWAAGLIALIVFLATAVIVSADPRDPPHPPQHLVSPDACSVELFWSVAPERQVNVSQRPLGTPGAPWEWVLSIEGDFPPVSVPFYGDHQYLAEVPGPTATFWPTPEPWTETPTAAPTQTPWVIVVTATPTVTPTPVSIYAPLVLRPRGVR